MGFRKQGMPSVWFDSLSLATLFPVEIKGGIDAHIKKWTWIKNIPRNVAVFHIFINYAEERFLTRTSEV